MLVRQMLPLIVSHACERTHVEGRTRFQKTVFLLQSRADFFRQKYDFIPHDYGPYSPDLQYDIDELIEKKLIDDELQTTDHGKIKYRYKITGEGTGIQLSLIHI